MTHTWSEKTLTRFLPFAQMLKMVHESLVDNTDSNNGDYLWSGYWELSAFHTLFIITKPLKYANYLYLRDTWSYIQRNLHSFLKVIQLISGRFKFQTPMSRPETHMVAGTAPPSTRRRCVHVIPGNEALGIGPCSEDHQVSTNSLCSPFILGKSQCG